MNFYEKDLKKAGSLQVLGKVVRKAREGAPAILHLKNFKCLGGVVANKVFQEAGKAMVEVVRRVVEEVREEGREEEGGEEEGWRVEEERDKEGQGEEEGEERREEGEGEREEEKGEGRIEGGKRCEEGGGRGRRRREKEGGRRDEGRRGRGVLWVVFSCVKMEEGDGDDNELKNLFEFYLKMPRGGEGVFEVLWKRWEEEMKLGNKDFEEIKRCSVILLGIH